ncbi:MAG: DUF4190 domain-containing protein [Ruminiclostridium sp.]|nr:DUF4190 domain-containing protein [Ruminiclostridium sp.]
MYWAVFKSPCKFLHNPNKKLFGCAEKPDSFLQGLLKTVQAFLAVYHSEAVCLYYSAIIDVKQNNNNNRHDKCRENLEDEIMNNDYNNQQPMPPMPAPPGKGMATGSMVCGIISLVTWWLGWGALIGLILGIVAIILSINAKKKGFVGGMVTAGLVMGIIGTVLCGIFFVACTACACLCGSAATSDWTQYLN